MQTRLHTRNPWYRTPEKSRTHNTTFWQFSIRKGIRLTYKLHFFPLRGQSLMFPSTFGRLPGHIHVTFCRLALGLCVLMAVSLWKLCDKEHIVGSERMHCVVDSRNITEEGVKVTMTSFAPLVCGDSYKPVSSKNWESKAFGKREGNTKKGWEEGKDESREGVEPEKNISSQEMAAINRFLSQLPTALDGSRRQRKKKIPVEY